MTHPAPLAAAEVEPIARWFLATLARAAGLRARQDEVGADYLVRRCRALLEDVRAACAAQGLCADTLFADVHEALDLA